MMANPKLQVANKGQYRTSFLDETGKMSQTWTKKLQQQDVTIQNLPQFFFQPASVHSTTSAVKVGVGSIFFETDTLKYFISDGKVWHQLGTAIS